MATVPLGGTAPRELLENVYDADWSPDGSEMAVIDRKDDKWRVEYPIGKVLLDTTNWITDLRVSPDGNYVAVFRHPPDSIDDRGNVLLLDREGKQRVISAEWEALQGMAWKPDGKEVWYSAAESGDSYCIRASNHKGEERTVFCGTGGSRLHDISGTGRVLVSSEVRRTTVALVDHGSNQETILGGVASGIDPRLTPDGRELVFTDASERGGKDYGVYLRKMDDGSAVRIGGGGYGSDVSNDGEFVLVVMPGEARVQVVPVGAGESQTLKWDGFQVSSANWFPDGQHILLFANAAGQPVGIYRRTGMGVRRSCW